jgi:candicidin polyketide synthase FscB
MFDDYRTEDILSVADVKIRGALLLDAYSRRHPVQVFCVFSSIAAVFGGLGMAAYSAANYFMDTLMARRRHEGLPGVAVNWGPWGEVGMFTDEMWSRIGESGMQPVLPEPGMEALMRVIAGDHYQYLAVCGDMDHYVNSYLHRYKTAVPSAPAAPPPAPVSPDASLCNDLLRLPAQQRYTRLLQLLQAEVVRILRLDDEQLDPQQGFFNIGMDSLTAIELRNSIKTLFGIAVPPTVLFEAPCLADLTSTLLEQMTQEKPASLSPAASSVSMPDDLQAIINDIDAAYTETV